MFVSVLFDLTNTEIKPILVDITHSLFFQPVVKYPPVHLRYYFVDDWLSYCKSFAPSSG